MKEFAIVETDVLMSYIQCNLLFPIVVVFDYTMVVFDWAISWSTLTAWSTFRIRLVLHVIPWSTKDVRRNACDIFRS